jgi:2-phosphosulfolactate phosphatase
LKVTVFPTVSSLSADESADQTRVVIDVLRATSTITAALANGARAILPVVTPEEAFEQVAELPAEAVLLGGERRSVRIEGFHLGNSPLEYTHTKVSGKTIIFTTTNGTRAVRRAAGAAHLLIASFLNVSAVAARTLELGKDLTILCAGTHDRFSLEDTACAGALVSALSGPDIDLELCDLSTVARLLYESYQGRLAELLHLSAHGQNLAKLGLSDDLVFCAQADSLAIVPELVGAEIRAPGAYHSSHDLA